MYIVNPLIIGLQYVMDILTLNIILTVYVFKEFKIKLEKRFMGEKC